MKIVIQRVSEASVTIGGDVAGKIGTGIMVLVGVAVGDTRQDAERLADKMLKLRIFPDENGVMNRSLLDVQGDLLIISQFTLLASTARGNRPSYINAARPEESVPLYEYFIELCRSRMPEGTTLATGRFGADMKVALVNDGPVTIVIDTKEKA
ncbi:MAG: D-aminoacyl-tRNA deacylase [Lachnoclostridium sp.]|nr:D-aminoacyl-tRNA deacylase [Lachnoclostridium sp.]